MKPAAFPLVVDLDGTLTPSDTLVESVVRLLKQSPFNLIAMVFWLTRGRAAFKRFVASRSEFSAEQLPYRKPLLDYLSKEKAAGRQIVLATASHKRVADEVSRHLGLFDDVIATENGINLKGRNKLKAIYDRVGEHFVYAGDSAADIPIWKSATAAVLVNASAAVSQSVRSTTPIETEFPHTRTNYRTWLRALRVHQWLKNLLIFVPLLTAFSFLDADKLITSTIAFFAFSLVASATYMINDILDIESDRVHPRKRFRPIANAEIPVTSVMLVALILLVAGLGLALFKSPQVFLMVLLYLVVTTGYSWFLKRFALVDVIVLSLLYTLRILVGSVAIEVPMSTWLLAFSLFLFLSLALVKRCSELVTYEKVGSDSASGRGYRVGDLTVLWPLGVGASVSAVVVFGLFINAPETATRYQSPNMLWIGALALFYWLSRLWIKASRGEIHDDPLVYAIRDRGSWVVFLAMVASMISALFL
ncbi:MAG: UbiA family prenyltransferase [Gammaproteobacteria bacterium]|nr:UbiA family prenyltransferase [Gammaproteobacteria bacterium]MDH3450175.1 UbiA family prenyltransferase [Gammaproteobacteria bacterium]